MSTLELDYGSFMYGSAMKSRLSVVESVHNTGMRLATGCLPHQPSWGCVSKIWRTSTLLAEEPSLMQLCYETGALPHLPPTLCRGFMLLCANSLRFYHQLWVWWKQLQHCRKYRSLWCTHMKACMHSKISDCCMKQWICFFFCLKNSVCQMTCIKILYNFHFLGILFPTLLIH